MAETVTGVQDTTRRMPRALLAVWVLLTSWAAVTGYYLIFSQFAPYDDEGYLMITFRNFIDGWPLYDEVYTQYGPAVYALKWVLHSGVGFPLTHEVTRFTSLAIWILTAFVSSIAIWRITRSAIYSALGYGMVFLCLSRITFEPGHPQDLCGLLIAMIALAATFVGPSEATKFLGLSTLGLALAFLFLTKLNMGVFVGLALAFCCLHFGNRSKLTRAGLFAFAAGIASMPVVLFYRYFDLGWFGFSVIIWAGLTCVFLTLGKSNDASLLVLKDQLNISSAFTLGIIAIILFTIARGTSWNELANGIFFQNLRFAGLFYLTAPTHTLAPYWSLASVALSLFAAYSFGVRSKPFELVLDLIGLSFGLAVAVAVFVAFFAPIYTHLILSFALPFVWLIVIVRDGRAHFVRTLLALASLMLAMQIFPIWGSQMSFASHLPLICGIVILADSFKSLSERYGDVLVYAERLLPAAACVVFLAAMYSAAQRYYSYERIDLPGSGAMRLPADTTADLNAVVAKAREDCSMLYSMPGMFSFNFWSGLETPTHSNATAWMTLLSDERQAKIIGSLESAERPCVIYHPKLAQNALRTVQLRDIPLARYVLDNFAETARHGEYVFLEKASR